jgi:hypothetical protein
MPLHRLVLVALLSGSACVAVEEPAAPGATLGDQAQLVTSAQRDMEEEEADVCAVLPVDGPCSHACDFVTLVSFVPAGTCAVFRCDLLDGREIAVHACRPGE